jgi:hypothetical protein
MDSTGVQYDAAVPVMPKWLWGMQNFSSTEYCSSSSSDVPWSLDDNSMADASMFSAGAVPMWAGEPWGTQSKYPNNN